MTPNKGRIRKGDLHKSFEEVILAGQKLNELFERDHPKQAAFIRRHNALPPGYALDKVTKEREEKFERSFGSMLKHFKIWPRTETKERQAKANKRLEEIRPSLEERMKLPPGITFALPQYEHLALAGQAIDPATREKMLLAVIIEAEKNEAVEVLRCALMVAVDKRIHGVLQGRAHLLNLDDHVKYLQDRHVLNPHVFEKPDSVLKAEFKDVTAKIAAHGNHRERNRFYRHLAALQPPHMAQATLDKIIPTFSRKSRDVRQKKIGDSIRQGFAFLAQTVDTLGKEKAAQEKMTHYAIDEMAVKISHLSSPAARVTAYQQLALLDPREEEAEHFFDNAYAITKKIKPCTTKAKLLILLRDNALTEDMRQNIHKKFVKEAPFDIFVKDIVSLRKRYDVQTMTPPVDEKGKSQPDYFGLLTTSWSEMDNHPPQKTDDQRLYEAHKPFVLRLYPSQTPKAR